MKRENMHEIEYDARMNILVEQKQGITSATFGSSNPTSKVHVLTQSA